MGEETRQIESFVAYCYTMTRNLALNRKELKVNQQISLNNGHNEGMEDSPLVQVVHAECFGLLLRLMQQLPGLQGDIIQLRDIEGMSYSEIASTLRLTEGQVKVYLFRARKKIKEMYLKVDGYGLQEDRTSVG